MEIDQSLRRTVVNMAWPVVLRTSLNMSMQMIDMIMVGSLGAVALAAVGLGNQIFFFTVTVVQAFSVGTTALVAQSVGSGNIESAKKYASQCLSAVLLSMLLLSALVVIFSHQIINGLVFLMPEKDLELIHLSSQYLGIIGISIPIRFAQIMVNGIFQGAGNTRIPLYLMIASNLINICSNYILIFGVGPVPALGVKGAAIATAGSGILIGLVGIALLYSRYSPITLDFKPGKFFHLQKDVLGQGAFNRHTICCRTVRVTI